MDKRKQSVTMHEIARLAGVSQSTVSRVFNGNRSVAPEKQAAVLEVMERLNYRPNLTAQGLVSGKTSTIGVLTRHLGSPFFGEILRGIGHTIQHSSYHPVIGLGSDNLNEELKALDLLLARRVDGLILQISREVTDDYLRELAMDIPLVIIGRAVAGLEGQCVCIKNQNGAYEATSYLIEKGHQLIAHVSGKASVRDAIARQEGYRQALLDNGLEFHPELMVEGDFTEMSGAMALDKLMTRRNKYPFTAIFAANDQMAAGVRLGLFHRGIAVPDEISLVGFDDMPSSEYMIPPLTTVRQPSYYMGLMAAQALLALLNGERFSLPEFPLELIVRQSVAFR